MNDKEFADAVDDLIDQANDRAFRALTIGMIFALTRSGALDRVGLETVHAQARQQIYGSPDEQISLRILDRLIDSVAPPLEEGNHNKGTHTLSEVMGEVLEGGERDSELLLLARAIVLAAKGLPSRS